MKSFLSYSSKDERFVDAVAAELGRQFCVVDKFAFQTGDDLVEAIKRGIGESNLFVLFASQNSLESLWVKLETEEAEKAKLLKGLSKALVFIIDPPVTHEQLPEWLKRTRISRGVAPKPVAREIRQNLDDLARDRYQAFFVGRLTDLEKVQRLLAPVDGSIPPRVAVVSGLSGIGRRTLASRVSKDSLNLRRQLILKVRPGDLLQDIAVIAADRLEPYSTAEEFKAIVASVSMLSHEAAVARIVRDFGNAVSAGELPILLDEGGIVDDDGRLPTYVVNLIQTAQRASDTYFFLVTNRRPEDVALSDGTTVPMVHLRALGKDDVRRLITSVSARESIHLTAPQINELADYVAGYPPSAYFSVELVRQYGIEAILADKRRLVEFRASAFALYLRRLKLDSSEVRFLRILSACSPLPLRVAGTVLELAPPRLNEALVKLINASLIVPDDLGLYWIAEPVEDAVRKEFGSLSADEYAAVARATRDYMISEGGGEPRLELSRMLFRAASVSGERNLAQETIHLASDWVHLARDMYHDERYELAVQFGREAVTLRPENTSARTFLIRSLIRTEAWDEARDQIEALRGKGAVKEAYFLTGFLERYRGRPRLAIAAYDEALRRGWGGVAIHRELAQCHFLEGNLKPARHHIDAAQEIERDNRYIVDLQIRIATQQRDEAGARARLDALEAIDQPAFYHHRVSTVEAAFGQSESAYSAAKQAVAEIRRPTIAMLAQLAECAIKTGRLAEASDLINRVEREFANRYGDIRIGLRCRWEIASGEPDNALALWERLGDKSKLVHKALRRDALQGLLASRQLRGSQRKPYEREIAALTSELAKQGPLSLQIATGV